MGKMKGQGFWVGVAVAALVLVAGWVYFVFPLGDQQDRLQNQVRSLASSLATAKMVGSKDVEAAQEYREKMAKEYEDIVQFYREADEHLERWFPGLAAGSVNRASFMPLYRGEIDRIHKELKDKGTQLGVPDPNNPDNRLFGFNWEEPSIDDWATKIGAADEVKVLQDLQKRFWARQRVADVILRPAFEIKVTRVHDFRFPRRLHERLTNAPWETAPQGENAVSYPGFSDPTGQIVRGFQEYQLPNDLGKTLTFGFALQLPYSEVPKVIKEIVQPGGEGSGQSGKGRLLVNLLGAHVTIREQNDTLITIVWKEGDLEERKQKTEEAQKAIKPRDVLLVVSCQIIDFDASKAKKFDAPPEAK